MSNSIEAVAPARNFAIDHLRAAMICVVMFGHALLPYVTVPRRFKDPATHASFDVVALFLYTFAMPLFFVTAGYAVAALFTRRGARGVFQNRLRTIFFPLLIAYFLLTPLTRASYQFAATVSTSGSLQMGIDVLLAGDWIRWSKAYHLWFLVSLLLYTAMAIGLRYGAISIAAGLSQRIAESSRALFQPITGPILLILIAAATLVPAYSLYDGDATTLPMQLHLFSFFIVGWFLHTHRDRLDDMAARPGAYVLIALLSLPVAAWSMRLRWFAPEQTDWFTGAIAGVSSAGVVVGMSFGLLGYFHRRFSEQPSPVGQYLSEASYWIFLIHLPLLIFVGGALSATALPATMKYLLTVAIVVPAVMATYHFGVRNSVLGRLLKGRPKETKN
ncbi:MAG: acyltransferase family protein [Woeseiaceae bacterium]|nr:acyltransferase family protein [Woeseiaceae bacterium]